MKPRDAVSKPIFAKGSRWFCHTAKHYGLEVEILRVNSSNITVKPIGESGNWSRQQRENNWCVPVHVFIRNYRPL